MAEIIVSEFLNNNEKRIALKFEYNVEVIAMIKTTEGSVWSRSHKFWHIPYSSNVIRVLSERFKGKLKFIYQVNKTQTETVELPQNYIDTLKLNNYSEATIKTYRLHFLRFLRYCPGINIDNIKHEQIRQYLLYLVEEKHYSTSAQNQAINSIKFYYEKVLGKPVEKYYVPRPRKEKTLPKILSETEVINILKSIDNITIKCMTFFIYSTGLTPSEVVYLKMSDIDSKNMKVFISSRKGDKDRYVLLSEKLLKLLREYYKIEKPKQWLFENGYGEQFSRRTFQKKFQEAVQKSGVKKKYVEKIKINT